MPGITEKVNVCGGSNGTVRRKPVVAKCSLPHHSFIGSSVSGNGFWSKHRDDVTYNQLQKFWCELTTQARQKLMRIDKQTVFEHARKNMYCSRCNGFLLEGYLHIVMYGKALQQNATNGHYCGRTTYNPKCSNLCIDNECQDDVIDPSLHPWGGLTTSKDGALTLLECYLHSNSLKGVQNVFDGARARERERLLLYSDACGGGGRGWIQGMTGHGRGHGTRENCALHTARLSVETLVDFWSALGEETRQSLVRMKEDDFIERLMYRFDSKRFCRDCRRNVIREFKELKELKRMRKDTCCTSWFCDADSIVRYEVSHDMVRADWHQTFLDARGTYHHFEWAVGTGEGKSDIMDFKNVGLSVKVQVNGLDLTGLSACYITLRAWKMDGECNELCVKAHALRGQQCVHCRLAVVDGYVTITTGVNIRRFFEQAEEAEEEEDDSSLDKDGNELDGEYARPRKHAKSPELAREFLLDAASVIFKEQIEKAFREGTARQNAYSIFVCLALKLLEDRVHVACKEIITLEKQTKLLEEEEKEKREEDERRERRRTKEREKKLRRKERLREKENKEKGCALLDTPNEARPCIDEGEAGEDNPPPSPLSPDIIQDDQFFMDYSSPNTENHHEDVFGGESSNNSDFSTSLPYNHYKCSRRKQDLTSKWSERRKGSALSESELTIGKYETRFHSDDFESTRSFSCFSKQLRTNAAKSNTRNGPRSSEKFHCTNGRVGDKCNSQVCSCNHHNDYRATPELHLIRSTREARFVNKLESSCDISKSYYREKCTQVERTRENDGQVKTNVSPVRKRVWEPLDSQKKCVQSNADSVIALKHKGETTESDQVPESSGNATCSDSAYNSAKTKDEDYAVGDLMRSRNVTGRDTEKGIQSRENSENCIKVEEAENGELCCITASPLRLVDSLLSNSSNSDSCSSCLSEGDSNTSSSNPQNPESTSTSDSEESSQTSEGRDMLHCLETARFVDCHKVVDDQIKPRRQNANSHEPASGAINSFSSLPAETAIYCESGKASVGVGVGVGVGVDVDAQPQSVLPTMMHNQNIQYPIYQAPTMGYYHHNTPVSWPTDGLMSFHYSDHYLFANGFGYDLNTNAQLLQYGGLQSQHLPPPLMNPLHMPGHPTVITQANVVCTNNQKVLNPEIPTVTAAEDGRNGMMSEKVADKGSNDFSLFHFGGPVALSEGFKAEAGTLKGGLSHLSLNSSEKSPDGCNRKDSIEEYNLFAASNGIKFSIY